MSRIRSVLNREIPPVVYDVVTWIARLVVGGVFVFSGFVKGVDPWGTIYKFHDYLAAMGLEIWTPLVLLGALALCALEFLTGILILFGCFRRSAPAVAALFMAVMLPLTLWIAVMDPVSDCGCFGDAYIISNWATFWKNVGLTLLILWLLKYDRRTHWGVTPALQWLVCVASGLFIGFFEFAGYYYQPVIDFRSYKVGNALVDESIAEDDDSEEFRFIYEKDGVRKEIGIDDEIPSEEDGWHFVERISTASEAAEDDGKDDGRNFRIWQAEDDEDVTADVMADGGKLLLITFPELKKVTIASSWKINSLYSWTLKNGIRMVGVASGTPEEIAEWIDLSMAEYPVFVAEDTVIKELVRGNPGVVYVVDGVIEWKRALRGIDIDDFLSPEAHYAPMTFRHDDHRLLVNIINIYITVMAVLVVLSFTPKIKDFYELRRRRRVIEKKDGNKNNTSAD